jgi:hypothetical protein
VVVLRVEVEREAVGFRQRVAPRELARDPLGRRIAQADARVERVIVEQQAELGGLARGLALVGVALEKAVGDRCCLPRGLVEPAVESDLARRTNGGEDARRARRGCGGGREGPERDRPERESGEREGAAAQARRARRARTSSSNLRISPCV